MRATQIRVKMSAISGQRGATPLRAPLDRDSGAGKNAGDDDRTHGGDERVHVSGRSFVIHML